MHHLRAGEQLTGLVDGSLGRAERREVEQHLAGCEECGAWVASYRLFGESLKPRAGSDAVSKSVARSTSGRTHLSSDDLSRFALLPETLGRLARERCSRHVEDCSECREEVALVRAAADQASEAAEQVPATATAGGPRFSRLAWAASFLLVVGVLVVGRSLTGVPTSRELADASFTGRTTVKAQDSILVGTSRVEPGAELTLKTGRTVAFGDGFSVGSDGTLSVVVQKSHDS